jgi:nicotinate-nucleotide adenylyltransferase
MKTVGLLGGTFDPIHRGHLDVACAAQRALALDEVWLVPARHPPHRSAPLASAAHRFAMVALALAGHPHLLVSDVEMNLDGPSYTMDTLERLEAAQPAQAGSIVFIAGADAFRDIRTWWRWQDLLARTHFAVVSRPGLPAAAMRTQLPDLASRMIDTPCTKTAVPGIFLIEEVTADVSSTEVRRHLANGRMIPGLLPDLVADYATRHGLYAGSAGLEIRKDE